MTNKPTVNKFMTVIMIIMELHVSFTYRQLKTILQCVAVAMEYQEHVQQGLVQG